MLADDSGRLEPRIVLAGDLVVLGDEEGEGWRTWSYTFADAANN